MKLIIAGGPKTGKTTLSGNYTNVAHTDDLITMGWSQASEKVVDWIEDPLIEVIEGVATLRALRKWLWANEEGKPCDELAYLRRPFDQLTKGQLAMSKGCWKVFCQIRPYLVRRGVKIKVHD